MEKQEIKIYAKVEVWQEYTVDVPNGMSKEKFVKELKEYDPGANYCENNGIETLFDTEKLIEVEYYDENEKLIDTFEIGETS